MYKFGKSSKAQLSTCQHELQEVMNLAITKSKYDFGISEGVRTEERQAKLVEEGRSRTLKSRHLANQYGMSEACDIMVYVDGEVNWDIKYYKSVARAVFESAIELSIPVEWGGLWENFTDGPHFQLGSK
jgi:peptidoglycan L-alanyl-D-glutamate endopeptidase CwlK